MEGVSKGRSFKEGSRGSTLLWAPTCNSPSGRGEVGGDPQDEGRDRAAGERRGDRGAPLLPSHQRGLQDFGGRGPFKPRWKIERTKGSERLFLRDVHKPWFGGWGLPLNPTILAYMRDPILLQPQRSQALELALPVA